MNATEIAALRQGAALHDELSDTVDERTLEIVERRRRTARVKGRGWLVRRMLLAADVAGLVSAFLLAELLFGAGSGRLNQLSFPSEFLLFALSLPVWVVVAKLYGLYDKDEERTDHSTTDDLAGVFHMVTVGAWLVIATGWATKAIDLNFDKLLVFWALAVSLVSLARVLARSLARRSVAYIQNTVIVGAGDVGQLVARKLLQHPEYGINVVGFVDDAPKERRDDLEHLTWLGAPDRLPAIVRMFDVERVIFAFSQDSHHRSLELVRSLNDLDVQIDVVPRFFELVGPNVGIHTVEGLPLVGLPPAKLSRSARLMKRALDLVVASVALVLSAPLFAYAAWQIKRQSPGPVFFRQTRLGIGMKEFTALKFRTMGVDVSDAAHRAYIKQTMRSNVAPKGNGLYKLEREDAVTPFGRWLRKTSLDELPQLINVLRGEMSLVGPRPCIPYEVEHFAPYHFERFLVPAGMTGFWQVTARAHSTFGEALAMDVAYARSWSLGLDLFLLLRTPLQMLRPRGTA